MKQANKFFTFRRKEDFSKGCLHALCADETGLHMTDDSQTGGVFLSHLLDSREEGLAWHRLVLQCNQAEETAIKLTIYASDSRTIVWNHETRDCSALLQDETLSIEQKMHALAPWRRLETEYAWDVLLHHVTGRYLVVRLDFAKQYGVPLVVERIRIYLPKQSWCEYLPEVYRREENGDFLDRYLSIFASIHQDIQEESSLLHRYFDPQTVPDDFLEWLAGWVGITDCSPWNREQLKILLKNAVWLYKIRGTRKSIEFLVELYTGAKPLIVESHEIEQFAKYGEVYKKLLAAYTDNPYAVTVMVKAEHIGERDGHTQLRKIIDSVRPAHVEIHLVILRKYMHLTSNMYLGVNSSLGQIEELRLDGTGSIPFVSVGRTELEEEKGLEE